MKREKLSFYYLLILIVKTIAGILLGGWILIVVLLMYLSMNDPDKREPSQSPEHRIIDEITSEVYLRNRTNSALFLMLKVSRSSLQMDTVWWGVNVAPEAVGRAIAAKAPYRPT